MNEDPKIAAIDAELSPGFERGKSSLSVRVEEENPFRLGFWFDNQKSPAIGSYRGEIRFRHINLTGWGDVLSAGYALTEGLDDYRFRYSVPVNRWDTTLSIGGERTETTVVADPFHTLNITSETVTKYVSVNQPLYETLFRKLSMGMTFDIRDSETFQDGEPFPYARGTDDGASKITVLRVFNEYVDRNLSRVFALRSTVNFGLDAFDSTINENAPDSRYVSWLGQFQWMQRLPVLNSKVIVGTDIQVSDDALLPSEKFSIGGMNTVRGYRENRMTTDGGLVGTLEWRIPVYRFSFPFKKTSPEPVLLEVIPFYDYGTGWNKDTEDPNPEDISSLGLGLRLSLEDRFLAEIYWGYGLTDFDREESYDIQDDGIHFRIGMTIY